MANLDVWVDIYTVDAAERTAKTSYLLEQTLVDDGSNMDDVIAAADALETAVDVLTWDHIDHYEIRVANGGGGASANAGSNNQIHARSYTTDSGGNACSFDIVAWDDDTYDQDSFNLLSTAYNVLAAAVANLLRNPDTGLAMANSVSRSVSKTHKSRGKKVV